MSDDAGTVRGTLDGGATVQTTTAVAEILGPRFQPEGTTPDGGPYSSMSKAELVAEIDKRNQGRSDDTKLSTTGNKPDLVAALESDDSNTNS